MREAALDIAKYIVSKCSNEGNPITNMELQRILYFCQKYFLQVYERPMFDDEFEAWPFGPCVPSIHYFFGVFGANPIQCVYEGIEIGKAKLPKIHRITREKRNQNTWEIPGLKEYQGDAWESAYKQGNHTLIPKEWIENELMIPNQKQRNKFFANLWRKEKER